MKKKVSSINISVDREFVETYPINWKPLKQQDINKIFSTRSLNKINQISLYIHMPFCPFVCDFCYFGKRLFNKFLYEKYIEALKKEIKMFKNHPDLENREVSAIYVGGGTGSILTPNHLNVLLTLIKEIFPTSYDIEITIESHPLTLNYNKLLMYREIGVNRISLGIQSFNRENLKKIQREKHYHANKRVIEFCKQIGFEKIAIDLIYRFPGQTIKNLLEDLEEGIGTDVDQISAYTLEVRDTPLENVMSEMPSDDVDKEMYYLIKDFCEEHGYVQYEQCDFARPQKYSRYSTNVWKTPQQLTLGFGAGAYSDHFGGYSWTNIYSVEKYIEIVDEGFFPGVLGSELNKKELMAKYMVLGSRCIYVNKNLFKILFDISFDEYFVDLVSQLLNRGWIKDYKENIIISREGLYYINNIAKKFYTRSNVGKKQPKHKGLASYIPVDFYRGGDNNG